MIPTAKKNLIIVPFDFTDQSYTALEHASIMASKDMSEIKLLHIFDDDSMQKLKKIGIENGSIQNTLESVSRDNESKSNVKTGYHLEHGHFLTGISKYIKSSNAMFLCNGNTWCTGITAYCWCKLPKARYFLNRANYHCSKKNVE